MQENADDCIASGKCKALEGGYPTTIERDQEHRRPSEGQNRYGPPTANDNCSDQDDGDHRVYWNRCEYQYTFSTRSNLLQPPDFVVFQLGLKGAWLPVFLVPST